ncbi:MAG: hypothetical protein K2J78_11365 [Muribaculaceae bacterium]|nr:hypothetical protein [Muribaculaceae bacterium]MDE6770312.1 hypothetical protein [Muribaculaceae bacterium]
MKPTKNHYFCPDCREYKMNFETEKEAYSFIEYESETILNKNGYCPIRAYKCPICGYWHLTSKFLPEDDCCNCCVRKEDMEDSRRLLGLVIRNTHTIALNLTRKVNSFSRLLNKKVVDWETVNLLAKEVIDIFEKVWTTPYRYLYNVRKQLDEFNELCHLYIWRKNQNSAA